MFQVKSVDDVLKIIKCNFNRVETYDEVIPLNEANGRITAEDIVSKECIPAFNRSTVDGYAVAASDTFGASEALPAQLRLLGEVRMGEKPDFSIKSGYASYIPTGGELPNGADAVVMIEFSENLEDGFIYLNKSAAPGNNVIFKGDDICVSETTVKAGTLLTPRHIGLLASIGCKVVKVKKRLSVGIISTGDEVVGMDDEVTGAKVRDVNSWFLYSSILSYGAIPVRYGIIKDNFEEIKETVGKALGSCDIVLISGGSSVGTRDETLKVIEALGEPGILVHGIAIKPGKPTIIGKVCNKAVIGLPGHPASAYMIYKIFVEYIMDSLNGLNSKKSGTATAYIETNYPSNNGREEFLPVRLEDRTEGKIAIPLFGKSGLMKMLACADGYIRIPRGTEGLTKGSQVDVILF